MKRKFVAGVLCLCMAVGLLPGTVLAEETPTEAVGNEEMVEQQESDWEYYVHYGDTDEDEVALITRYKGTDTELEVPAEIDGYKVTGIDSYVFGYCEGLKNIILPEGVKRIEDYAFLDCDSLESITLPEGVESIGKGAFRRCVSLKNITLPEGITSIEEGVFFACSSLESITLPEGVKSIGSEAFSHCVSLKDITLPEGMESIGSEAFSHCYSLKNITLPEGVESIGSGAFKYCDSLESITLPGSVTNVEDEMFSGCDSLKNITLPEGVESIGSEAFSCCYSLESIILPEGVKSIGSKAFQLCKGLKNITLPEGITSIEKSVFSGCYSLKNITLPEGVESIGSGAFRLCENLESITLPGSVTSIEPTAFATFGNTQIIVSENNEKFCSVDGVLFDKNKEVLIACVNKKAYKIPEGVTTIGKQAFSGSMWFESIVLPEGVTSIEEGAFWGKPLESITLPEGVTRVGIAAFMYCEYLKSIMLPKSLTSIDTEAFYNCNNLTDVYYAGSEEEWNSIVIGSDNDSLSQATIHYNSDVYLFNDVRKSDWFCDAVAYVKGNGLMTGLNGTTFGPDQSLARAQFAVILHRMNGEPEVAYTAKFADVPDGEWYTSAVLWANSVGVVNGYTDSGLFGTADKINREQMAVMMYRYAGHMGYDTSARADFSSFSDAAKVSEFADEAMQWAVANKIIMGKDNGTRIDPQGNANRAECATIIMRFVEKFGKN